MTYSQTNHIVNTWVYLTPAAVVKLDAIEALLTAPRRGDQKPTLLVHLSNGQCLQLQGVTMDSAVKLMKKATRGAVGNGDPT